MNKEELRKQLIEWFKSNKSSCGFEGCGYVSELHKEVTLDGEWDFDKLAEYILQITKKEE